MKYVAPVLIAAALATGCASTGGAFDGVQGIVADFVLPPEQAAQLGARAASEIEAKKRTYRNAGLEQIGHRLLAQAGPLPRAYAFTFKVIDEGKTVNAFALPGGQIYVTSAMMQLASTEGQIAAVLAHEIAHVTERHVAERLAADYSIQALTAAALGQNAGAVTQLAGSVLQQGFLMRYSRSHELEADRVGLGLMRRAGYDPRDAVTIFRKLESGSGGGSPEFLSSHPSNERRIEQLEDLIRRGS